MSAVLFGFCFAAGVMIFLGVVWFGVLLIAAACARRDQRRAREIPLRERPEFKDSSSGWAWWWGVVIFGAVTAQLFLR
ncbi:MAG TPA: hypothetical protein VNH41_05015 [Steroidobacteraceae bacterium]|nr:hypothetical protein [Steroidobacteraceae bacterium]